MGQISPNKPFITTMADDLKQTEPPQKQTFPSLPAKQIDNEIKKNLADISKIHHQQQNASVAPIKKPAIPSFSVPQKPSVELLPIPPKLTVPPQLKPAIPLKPISLPRIIPPLSLAPKQTTKPDTSIQPKEKPALSQNPPVNTPKPENTTKSNYRKILFFAIITIIVISGISGYYFWLEKSPLTPNIIEEKKPASLISTLNDEIISIEENATPQIVWQKIIDLLEQKHPDGFKRILIKTSKINAKSNTIAYPNFPEFLNNLNIYFPDFIINNANNFTFFINTENDNDRLGIIIEMNDNAMPNNAENVLKLWEENSILENLSPFAFPNSKNDSIIPDTASFNSNQYKNIDIRYVNFKGNENSIDYMFLKPQKMLVITTSKNSTYETINNVLEKK